MELFQDTGKEVVKEFYTKHPDLLGSLTVQELKSFAGRLSFPVGANHRKAEIVRALKSYLNAPRQWSAIVNRYI